MNTTSFQGLIPILQNFNSEIFLMFSGFPLYMYKIAIGIIYGVFFGFFYGFWKKEIVFGSLIVFFSFWLLNWLKCVTLNWYQIYIILGIGETGLKLNTIVLFIKNHYFEILISLTIVFFMNKIINRTN